MATTTNKVSTETYKKEQTFIKQQQRKRTCTKQLQKAVNINSIAANNYTTVSKIYVKYIEANKNVQHIAKKQQKLTNIYKIATRRYKKEEQKATNMYKIMKKQTIKKHTKSNTNIQNSNEKQQKATLFVPDAYNTRSAPHK